MVVRCHNEGNFGNLSHIEKDEDCFVYIISFLSHNEVFESLLTGSIIKPNFITEEEKMKESVVEYEKDERLDLEDNEPEYEVEEYSGVDYYDKEIDQDDDHEVVDEGDEHDDNVVEEDDGDMAEEELEDVHEELEGEEYEEHVVEEQEHEETVDAEEDDHHELVKERRKRKEFEVFVGGLDKDATEDDLRKAFMAVGEVTEVRLMMNPQTKKNKGFAFLRFATVEQAKRAVTELKNPVVIIVNFMF